MIVRKLSASLSIRSLPLLRLGKMDFIATFAPTYSTLFKVLVVVLAFFNVKNFPFAWHYRVFRAFILRLTRKPKRPLDANCLFLPSITTSHAPLTESDFNMHKSNSTYLSDLDISRVNYAALIFGEQIATGPWSKRPVLMLGGVQIIFRKEIKPYADYEIWSKVLSWDDKWFYLVSHFVQKGAFRPRCYLQDKHMSSAEAAEMVDAGRANAKALQEGQYRKVYASSLSRIVAKRGRETVKPADMMTACGILPKDPAALAKIEERRLKDLKLALGENAWEGLHATFFDSTELALGKYTDLFFRGS